MEEANVWVTVDEKIEEVRIQRMETLRNGCGIHDELHIGERSGKCTSATRGFAVKCFKYFLRSVGDVEEKGWKERRGDWVVEEVREKERTMKWADVRGNEEMEEAEGQRVGTEKKTDWMELLDQGKRRRSYEENRGGEGQRKVVIGSEKGQDRVWDGACCLVTQTRGNARSTGRDAGQDRKGEGKRKREVRNT